MPKDLERALKRVAKKYARQGKLRKKSGESLKEAKDHFVYRTMNRMGYMHGNKRVKRG